MSLAQRLEYLSNVAEQSLNALRAKMRALDEAFVPIAKRSGIEFTSREEETSYYDQSDPLFEGFLHVGKHKDEWGLWVEFRPFGAGDDEGPKTCCRLFRMSHDVLVWAAQHMDRFLADYAEAVKEHVKILSEAESALLLAERTHLSLDEDSCSDCDS